MAAAAEAGCELALFPGDVSDPLDEVEDIALSWDKLLIFRKRSLRSCTEDMGNGLKSPSDSGVNRPTGGCLSA